MPEAQRPVELTTANGGKVYLAQPQSLAENFIVFTMHMRALRFLEGSHEGGRWKTKAGRFSPYFFNSGLFNDGISIGKLAFHYASKLKQSGVEFDMLFGPAYKGIPLVATVAMALGQLGDEYNRPFAFNRKEDKDHGEGGNIVGELNGRVLVVDDVISAGTSVRESVDLIRAAKARLAGVLISLDRQEKGQGELSAVQEVYRDYGVPVVSIATRQDIVAYFERSLRLNKGGILESWVTALREYGAEFGVDEVTA